MAFNVDTLDDLYAMRDRIRDRGVPVIGPIDHGMCHSIYFAGPEGLSLEIACGGAIDERAWIDPEVQALAQDPAVLRALERGDRWTLLRHPGVQRLAEKLAGQG